MKRAAAGLARASERAYKAQAQKAQAQAQAPSSINRARRVPSGGHVCGRAGARAGRLDWTGAGRFEARQNRGRVRGRVVVSQHHIDPRLGWFARARSALSELLSRVWSRFDSGEPTAHRSHRPLIVARDRNDHMARRPAARGRGLGRGCGRAAWAGASLQASRADGQWVDGQRRAWLALAAFCSGPAIELVGWQRRLPAVALGGRIGGGGRGGGERLAWTLFVPALCSLLWPVSQTLPAQANAALTARKMEQTDRQPGRAMAKRSGGQTVAA